MRPASSCSRVPLASLAPYRWQSSCTDPFGATHTTTGSLAVPHDTSMSPEFSAWQNGTNGPAKLSHTPVERQKEEEAAREKERERQKKNGGDSYHLLHIPETKLVSLVSTALEQGQESPSGPLINAIEPRRKVK